MSQRSDVPSPACDIAPAGKAGNGCRAGPGLSLEVPWMSAVDHRSLLCFGAPFRPRRCGLPANRRPIGSRVSQGFCRERFAGHHNRSTSADRTGRFTFAGKENGCFRWHFDRPRPIGSAPLEEFPAAPPLPRKCARTGSVYPSPMAGNSAPMDRVSRQCHSRPPPAVSLSAILLKRRRSRTRVDGFASPRVVASTA